MSNPLVNFFKKIGRGLGLTKLGKLLAGVSHLFTEEQLDHALDLVRAAIDKFEAGANRKTWVVHMLQTQFHLPLHLANLLTELAVAQLKHAEDEAFKKLDDVLVGGDEVVQQAPEPTPEGVVVSSTTADQGPKATKSAKA